MSETIYFGTQADEPKHKNLQDFDQFWSEKNTEGYPFRLFGEDHILPAGIPAGIVLRIMRLRAEGKEDVPDSEVVAMAESVFGRDKLDYWCSKGMTIDQMGDLISWALEHYQAQRPLDQVEDRKSRRAVAQRGRQR